MRVAFSRYALVVSVLVLASLACNAVSSLGGSGGSAGSSGGDSGSSGAGPSLLKDDFSKSDSGWGTGTDAQSSIEYQDGGLHMQMYKDHYFTWSNPDQSTYENVHMEVTVKNQNGSTRAGFGLMCNQQVTDGSYYYFAITSDGQYAIGKSAVAKDDLFLTNNDQWGDSSLVPKNAASYRIGADCGPGALTLYVNGQKVDSVTDTSYTNGGVGLFLWSGEKAAGEVTYDDFVMTQLK